MNVNIEFDDDTVVQVDGNVGSFTLGNNTYMSVWDGDLTVDQEIHCFSSISKIQLTIQLLKIRKTYYRI